ncbi:MAG: ATP synthase F1 subunit epsilon [Christensenellales bacterium]
MASFSLKILACDRLFFEGDCDKLIFPAYDGDVEILANHEQLTAQIAIGELRYVATGVSDWQKAVVSGGIVTVDNNVVTVIVYSAEKPEEIDAARARAAKEKAEAELKEKQSGIDRRISSDSLNRAVQRLRSSGN